MARKHCGGKKSPGPKTVPVQPYRRPKPGDTCYGPGAWAEDGPGRAAQAVQAVENRGLSAPVLNIV